MYEKKSALFLRFIGMKKLHQVTHVKVILGYLGVILHVPGVMAFASLFIALIFEEFFSIIPFLVTMALSLGIGQLLYRVFYEPRTCHLWDAMIIAALSWLFIPILSIIPYYWITIHAVDSGQYPSVIQGMATIPNTLFESFSSFTSTGLSVVKDPAHFPKTFQWWRTFTCWVGGTGLIVFVLSLTQPGRGQYRLYYSEARSETVGETIGHTAQIIAFIYSMYTVLGIIAYTIAGMPFWAAINHSMTSVATGGFTIVNTSFMEYNAGIKVIGIILMFIGATSFALHYKMIKERKISLLLTNLQESVFLVVLFLGIILSLFLKNYDSEQFSALDLIFNYVSAATTCGFSASPIVQYLPNLKLVLIFAMLIGGCSGSTSGGVKVQRYYDLLEGVYVRMQSMTEERERFIKAVRSKHSLETERFGLPMGATAERLYAAGILLTMWMVSLFLGWFFMLFAVPSASALDALFEVFSAMSNAGLSTGIMSETFSTYGKFVYLALMWMGRLEILPALILVWGILFPFGRKGLSR